MKGGQQVAIVQSGRQPIWRSASTHAIQVSVIVCKSCQELSSSHSLTDRLPVGPSTTLLLTGAAWTLDAPILVCGGVGGRECVGGCMRAALHLCHCDLQAVQARAKLL